jgi:hypothetical protein
MELDRWTIDAQFASTTVAHRHDRVVFPAVLTIWLPVAVGAVIASGWPALVLVLAPWVVFVALVGGMEAAGVVDGHRRARRW